MGGRERRKSPPRRRNDSPRRSRSPRPQSPRGREPERGEKSAGGEADGPTFEVEESKSRTNGGKTWQAVLKIKEKNGRDRFVRGRPRTSKNEANKDGHEMVEAFVNGGHDALRKVQAAQRLTDHDGKARS